MKRMFAVFSALMVATSLVFTAGCNDKKSEVKKTEEVKTPNGSEKKETTTTDTKSGDAAKTPADTAPVK